jgi:hypothetical protein
VVIGKRKSLTVFSKNGASHIDRRMKHYLIASSSQSHGIIAVRHLQRGVQQRMVNAPIPLSTRKNQSRNIDIHLYADKGIREGLEKVIRFFSRPVF